MKRLITLLAVVLAAVVSSTAAARSDASCSGAQLKGSFSVVRGSAGAGNITYKLTAAKRVEDAVHHDGSAAGAAARHGGKGCRRTSGRRSRAR